MVVKRSSVVEESARRVDEDLVPQSATTEGEAAVGAEAVDVLRGGGEKGC